MKFELVMQEKVGDCGPACVAMVLGCSLSRARGILPRDKNGATYSSDIVECLCQNGVPAIESIVWPRCSVPAILTVPSLNHVGLLHFILWDGERYLDTSHEAKRYPHDGPVVSGELQEPQWSTAILVWPKEEGE